VHTQQAAEPGSKPIRYSPDKTGVPQSLIKGMEVVVTNLDVQGRTIKATVMVDNLVKGAAGAILQLAEWVEVMERTKIKITK